MITTFSFITAIFSKSNKANGTFVLLTFLLFSFSALQAQVDADASFRNTLQQRSEKIVNSLSLSKENKKKKIISIIAEQYYQLNKLHDNSKAELAVIKEMSIADADKKIKTETVHQKKEQGLVKLHQQFVKRLNRKLDAAQVEKIKDGMTYNVLNVTYAAYQDMILSLTDAQKKKIYDWLVEAREKAMDEGSSDDKHKVFGKYKGKINNYLSSEGYDMKAEEKKWQQRLREKREAEDSERKKQTA